MFTCVWVLVRSLKPGRGAEYDGVGIGVWTDRDIAQGLLDGHAATLCCSSVISAPFECVRWLRHVRSVALLDGEGRAGLYKM